MELTGAQWSSLGLNGYYWSSLELNGHYWSSLGLNGYYRSSPGLTGARRCRLLRRARAGNPAQERPARRHADPPRAPWEPRAWWERPRRRRALQEEEEECGKSEGKCCLRSLKVSFQDIGWADWVVAPKSYYMRFCQGSCPHNYRAASMHAQVQARVHALARGAPAPCCVPAAYEPMVLMHYDAQGRLVSTVFEDMLVTKCHCA
ncbi:growth/differentiation factor 15 [Eudromia elegans]